ncbi:MAG: diguanylate cyclase [Planctomycetota bacterium]
MSDDSLPPPLTGIGNPSASQDGFSTNGLNMGTSSTASPKASVGEMLRNLSEQSHDVASGLTNQGIVSDPHQNHLAVVRLGIAASLFYALRTKHQATAAHGLRVALSCSAWCNHMSMNGDFQDRLEVAALLHDLGKIGIADRILRKPGQLTTEEKLTIDLAPDLGVEILRGCIADQELLDIIRYGGRWFNSRRQDDGPCGDAIPLGARMLSITDAYDSMTTDTVYRAALTREMATVELNRGAGSQFDPELVHHFTCMVEADPTIIQKDVSHRWLRGLQSQDSNRFYSLSSPAPQSSVGSDELRSFHQRLVETTGEAVAFLDNERTILRWNVALEELTGIPADAIEGTRWESNLLELRDCQAQEPLCRCPIEEAFRSQTDISDDCLMVGSDGNLLPIQIRVSPVRGQVPGNLGMIISLRDQSTVRKLQGRIETLAEQNDLDPLTKVANRACFDRTLAELIEQASTTGSPLSLIICDIDHFKAVNDTHGHQAGDEALVSFANLLKAHSRQGDLVVRYGGEEFLLLTPGCDTATCSRRAEAIRVALEQTPLSSLNNESVTASFGVTEFQGGDTAESIVARADRALLRAKDTGRNRVIQLGGGAKLVNVSEQKPKPESSWLSWFGSSKPARNKEINIATPVPVEMAIEKLKGFIADHRAEIISVDDNQLSIRVKARFANPGRRKVDHQVQIRVDMELAPDVNEVSGAVKGTIVQARLTPNRHRDRRDGVLEGCFDQVQQSLKSYLMGQIV